MKLAFQMSIIDYSKTTNRSINLLDLYLLLFGYVFIYIYIYIGIRNKTEGLVRIEITMLLESIFFCLGSLFNC